MKKDFSYSPQAQTGLSPLHSFAMSLVMVMLGTQYANAAGNLGDVICSAVLSVGALPKVMSSVAYVAGALFAALGINALRVHSQDASRMPLRQPISQLIAAGFLFSLPQAISTIVGSVFGANIGSNKGLTTCTAGAIKEAGLGGGGGGGGMAWNGGSASGPRGTFSSSSGDSAGLGTIAKNFFGNINGPLITLIGIIAVSMGVFLIIKGLFRASKYGTDAKTTSATPILGNLVIGGLLTSTGSLLPTILQSLFGSGQVGDTTLKWSAGDMLGSDFSPIIAACLGFVQVLGVIAVVRGLLVFKNAVEGNGNATLPQGFVHVIGGAMAINIAVMLKLFDATFGTGLLK